MLRNEIVHLPCCSEECLIDKENTHVHTAMYANIHSCKLSGQYNLDVQSGKVTALVMAILRVVCVLSIITSKIWCVGKAKDESNHQDWPQGREECEKVSILSSLKPPILFVPWKSRVCAI